MTSVDDTSEDNSVFSTLDHRIDDKYFKGKDIMSIAQIIRGQTRPRKRQKTEDLRPVVYVRFNARRGQPKPVTLTALLDTGASATLIAEKYSKKLKLRSKKSDQVWTTPAGSLKTTATCRTQFSMPELHDNRVIEWEFHVTKNMGAYDMIIGRDILTDLGIDVKCSNMTVSWDNADIPWKDMALDMEENFHINEPEAVEEEMSCIRKILDNDYGKVIKG